MLSDKEKICNYETLTHIRQVQFNMHKLIAELQVRALVHDVSKLESPELETFTEWTEKLSSLTFGSQEYKDGLEQMKPALDHHYAENDHHPEYYRKYVCDLCHKEYDKKPNDNCEACGNGWFSEGVNITEMDLIQLLEMIADWKAATMRHKDGDINKSLEINQKRFNMSPELVKILKNTINRYL